MEEDIKDFDIVKKEFLEEREIKIEIKTEALDFVEAGLVLCEEPYIKSEKYPEEEEENIAQECKKDIIPSTSGDIERLISIDCFTSLANEGNLDMPLEQSDGKLYKCWKCNFETNKRRALKSHLSLHSDIKKFKCPECNYGSKRRDHFMSHFLTHSNLKKFKCSKCNYATNHKRDFTTHSLTHSGIKQFKCSECNYGANRKDHLMSHILIHSNIKRFKCSMCDYVANHKKDLTAHLLTHLDTQKINCSQCYYVAGSKKEILTHLLSHSGKGNFKCSNRNYKANRKGHLHSLTRSGKKTEWSVEEKLEIYWCATYARHSRFPKKGTSIRARDMMLIRGKIERQKIEATPDSRFVSIYTNMKLGKTSITISTRRKIQKEVEDFINANPTMTGQKWEWTFEKNMFLMESHYMALEISKHRSKSVLLEIKLRRKEISPIDFLIFRVQSEYADANISREDIIRQRYKIIKITREKDERTLHKVNDIIPSHNELKCAEETAKCKLDKMEFTQDLIEKIKSSKENEPKN